MIPQTFHPAYDTHFLLSIFPSARISTRQPFSHGFLSYTTSEERLYGTFVRPLLTCRALLDLLTASALMVRNMLLIVMSTCYKLSVTSEQCFARLLPTCCESAHIRSCFIVVPNKKYTLKGEARTYC